MALDQIEKQILWIPSPTGPRFRKSHFNFSVEIISHTISSQVALVPHPKFEKYVLSRDTHESLELFNTRRVCPTFISQAYRSWVYVIVDETIRVFEPRMKALSPIRPRFPPKRLCGHRAHFCPRGRRYRPWHVVPDQESSCKCWRSLKRCAGTFVIHWCRCQRTFNGRRQFVTAARGAGERATAPVHEKATECFRANIKAE